MIEVLDLGGSIVAQEKMDIDFLKKMKTFVEQWLQDHPEDRMIIVIGGGYPARVFQQTCRAVVPQALSDDLDWVGIMATRLNAQLVKTIFGTLCQDPVVYDPSEVKAMSGRILVGAGWKPGFSTDYDAVVLAENFGAKRVLNLSNIQKVYTADPKKDPEAKPLDSISWNDYRVMTGDDWTPGMNAPFDPVASKRAQDAGLEVVVAEGRDLDNLEKILKNQDYLGTSIHP